jgi:hypothetical protein
MITNGEITVYHKTIDNNTRLEKWIRYNYEKVWYFGGKGASINEGYENANDVNVRIWYDLNNGLDINNFAIGDILVRGNLSKDIETQQDLSEYEIYSITSITNNNYGNSKHIRIGGK